MMTVRQWLAQNLTSRDGYTEAHMYDASGNVCMFWYGDADPKYDAHVIRVEDADDWHISANVYTDYTEAETINAIGEKIDKAIADVNTQIERNATATTETTDVADYVNDACNVYGDTYEEYMKLWDALSEHFGI